MKPTPGSPLLVTIYVPGKREDKQNYRMRQQVLLLLVVPHQLVFTLARKDSTDHLITEEKIEFYPCFYLL